MIDEPFDFEDKEIEELFDFEDEEIDDQEPCPFCHGSAHSIGTLGHTEWYRCEDCGGEFSI